MKLLFDEQLSPGLARLLDDIFPGSAHVRQYGLEQANDHSIWRWAGVHEFTIVTKDKDFLTLATVLGPPPKVIRLDTGNTSTAAVEKVLRAHSAEIHTFGAHPRHRVLVLS